MRTIRFEAQEHDTVAEALQWLEFEGDRVIGLAGRIFTVTDAEYRRLQESGIQPATWHFSEAAGRIVCVPGNC